MHRTLNRKIMKGCALMIFFILFARVTNAQDNPADADPGNARLKGTGGHDFSREPGFRNIIGLAPLQFTEQGVAGISISCEHAIDAKSIVALYIPAILEFNTSNEKNRYGTSRVTNDPMVYIMPGIKIYPTGSYGKTKYAAGPSLVIAGGRSTSHDYAPYIGYSNYLPQDHFVLGMMINQSLNISPLPRFYYGTELGMGLSYINKIGSVSQETIFLFQLNFKVGYKF
jgi:hypothetical protein